MTPAEKALLDRCLQESALRAMDSVLEERYSNFANDFRELREAVLAERTAPEVYAAAEAIEAAFRKATELRDAARNTYGKEAVDIAWTKARGDRVPG